MPLKFEVTELPNDLVQVAIYSGDRGDQVYAGDLVIHQNEWAVLLDVLVSGSEGKAQPIRITHEVPPATTRSTNGNS